jgi:hypothetical protein
MVLALYSRASEHGSDRVVLLFPADDAPQLPVRANENVPVRNGQRRVHRLSANGVGGQAFELRTGAEHEDVGVAVGDVEAVARQHGRGPGRIARAGASKAFLPEQLAGGERADSSYPPFRRQ